MANREQYTAQQFIDAIKDSAGIISTIAARVGCDWWTADRYIKKYSTVQAAYDAEVEKGLDIAESVVLGNIRAASKQQRDTMYGAIVDSADAKWYLSRKGKRRGYVERSEVTGADGAPLVIEYVNDWRNAEQD
jgi:hypothetical protein